MRKTRKVEWLGFTWSDSPHGREWASALGIVSGDIMREAIKAGNAVEVREPVEFTLEITKGWPKINGEPAVESWPTDLLGKTFKCVEVLK